MLKSLKFILIIILILFSSCTATPLNLENKIIGKWKVISTSGGESGFGYNPNFKFLYIDAALTFRLDTETNNTIAKGDLLAIDRINDKYSIKFRGRELYIPEQIQLLTEFGYAVDVNEFYLKLTAPCCFSMDTTFSRVE